MKFQIEENSAVPVIRQIQEQIKLSISMGMLKRGDILPSIRQIERDTGINRGQIHRAFQCLYSSGLLSHAQGNRTMVSVSAAAPDSVNKKCKAFSDDVIERIRRIGISPIAFARYLGSHARENERRSPFIAYVDSDKDTAIQRAQQLSKLWHASITGLSVEEFKSGPAGRNPIRKILVNHLSFDSIRRVIQARQIDIIPIEIRYTEQTIRELGKMRASSMLVLLPDHAASSARFIVDQLHKWIRSKDVKISWMAVKAKSDFKKILNDRRYGRVFLSPGARRIMPEDPSPGSRIHQLFMEFDTEALEIARIRAGIIV